MTVPGLTVEQNGPVLTVAFDRPERRNAMTWEMYSALYDACEQADTQESVRLLLLTGRGGSFVSGTDIEQFSDFESGNDGVIYEGRIAEVVNRLEGVSVPTLATIDGACVGGGLVMAAACDLRVATRRSAFGMPVARSLGNCLSMNSVSLLVSRLGSSTVLDLVLRARMMCGEEALTAGFIVELCEDAEHLQRMSEETVNRLLEHAPLTMWATKVAVGRLRSSTLPPGDDFVDQVFGSEDFRRGVEAFAARERAVWTGR